MTKTIFELTEGNAPALTDYALTGEDPLGTHVLRRTTWQSIRNLFVGATTAANDFIVGNGTVWQKKTLAETKIVLGATSIGGVAHKQLWIAGWKPTLTGGCALPAQIEMGTNKNVYDYLAFIKAADKFAYANVLMPDDYSGGGVCFKAYWLHPATTTNFGVVWGLSGAAVANGATLDTPLASVSGVADTGGTANYLYISDLSPALTIDGSPAAGKFCHFKIGRYTTNVNDTLAVDAYLLGVMIWYPVV